MRRIIIVVALSLLLPFAHGQDDFFGQFAGDFLSDEDQGSKDYDHEAFLGEGAAEEFDNFVPQESQRRLGEIFVKIDVDNNGTVTVQELEKWIATTQDKTIQEDTSKRLEKLDLDNNDLVTWEEYYNVTYGKLKKEDWDAAVKDGINYRDMLNRDKKRWATADTDGDDSCDLSELKAFNHPQHFDHMKELVFQETMTDLDKNGDGFLDLDEFINDVYKPENEGDPEPDWLAGEKEQFKTVHDKDGDGKLDENEIRDWVMPDDRNYALSEAKHLIQESDSDKDGVLTKQEVLDHYDTFVGSQATEWGEMFEGHDEF